MTSTKNQFHSLRIRDVRRETPSAVSISFDVPAPLQPQFSFKAGQYLTLKADINGEDVRRNYSVCASPLDGELRVAIKALPGGRFSTYANQTLRAGDVLEVLPASGHFTTEFAPGQTRHYAAFAAGSGITPVLSLIRTALQTAPSSRFTLFYGNRHSTDILFLEELAGLKNLFMERLEVFHFLSAEEDDIALFNGRLTLEKCNEILRTLINPAEIDLFFICGPEGMMLAAEAALLEAGIEPAKILLERFAAAGESPAHSAQAREAAQAAAGRKIGVVLDGRKSTVTFNAELGNILDSVRAAGMSAPYACKGGVCATCRAKVISGSVEMLLNYGLTDDEVAQGYILTCQSTPKSDDVVISYDS
ncbi:1,2-phenylacetyl-CoA epoxidase subunit PaaE [Acidocella aromatica]|uniref:Ring-1,2-phenylacetyl-CoA epoxidase subunit PaaE n=1 Tax=Acidocella aromatica TaxID=1303579 RepID=A0A840VDQ8_9PROT|nr:1,2-phenylacetyl-CoA epoxidase subunit PaaE [Acidocella aromatica]MBB5373007.1 ring-1,2-phenylacetyl-CoA epoxidase subunit PaaE [Acidocella aromatica]